MGRLVLTRRRNESFIVDGKTTVTIIGCSHGKVRIGIDAPPDIHVIRDDVQNDAPEHEEKSVKRS